MLEPIQAALEAITHAATLYDEANFAARADALDTLEFAVIARLAELAPGDSHAYAALREAAGEVRRRLDSIDARLFRRLRKAIRAGTLKGQALRDTIVAYAAHEDDAATGGYDALDVFVNRLLGITSVPTATLALAAEMVAYQKTPVRTVLRLLELAALSEHDVFYDLGAGLGQIPILVHLLSGAQAVGIEIEPAYCAAARASAARLGLDAVTFVEADARVAAYTRGTVFFLYTPFSGRMLADVLERLREQAGRPTTRVIAFGPCVSAVALQEWLVCEHSSDDGSGELALFGVRQTEAERVVPPA